MSGGASSVSKPPKSCDLLIKSKGALTKRLSGMGPFHFAVGKITWWDYLNQHCGCPPPWSPFGPLFANKEARPRVTVAGYQCIQKTPSGFGLSLRKIKPLEKLRQSKEGVS